MPEVTQEVSGRGECWSLEHIAMLCGTGTPMPQESHGIHGAMPTHLLFGRVSWEKPATSQPPLCSSLCDTTGVHNPALLQHGTLYRLPVPSSASQSLQPGSSQSYGAIISLLFSLKAMRINKQKHWLEQKRMKAWHLFYHLQLPTDILWYIPLAFSCLLVNMLICKTQSLPQDCWSV